MFQLIWIIYHLPYSVSSKFENHSSIEVNHLYMIQKIHPLIYLFQGWEIFWVSQKSFATRCPGRQSIQMLVFKNLFWLMWSSMVSIVRKSKLYTIGQNTKRKTWGWSRETRIAEPPSVRKMEVIDRWSLQSIHPLQYLPRIFCIHFVKWLPGHAISVSSCVQRREHLKAANTWFSKQIEVTCSFFCKSA